ncbi:hypothetical protein [Clostridium guangxiense]|nr:hypothetical protein [Clostridium guangxiense]
MDNLKGIKIMFLGITLILIGIYISILGLRGDNYGIIKIKNSR